jgi:hypothetical protein
MMVKMVEKILMEMIMKLTLAGIIMEMKVDQTII